MIIDNINKESFFYFKDEPNEKGALGITHNRIVEIPNFVDAETATSMISYFESKAHEWGDIAFYGSSGMGLMSGDPDLPGFGLTISFFDDLREKFREAVELVFERPVKPNTSHAQKWDIGGFANPHSDNSDSDGKPNAFEINKYVGILYLNDTYGGGELYFPDHNIEFRPKAYSYYVFPGGVENIHGVKEITDGTRYTMVSFWDFKEAEYSDERKREWDEEIAEVRRMQAKQKEEWSKGNKFA
jgi:hypothetical protein